MGVLDRFRLDDRVAVVTGSSSGLGVSFAHALAEAGARVVLGARRLDRLEQVADDIRAAGGTALPVACDVTDPEDCAALVERAVGELGRVDVLVNNAGYSDAVPALRQDPEDFAAVLAVNLQGAFSMATSCAAAMAPGSSIVNVSSVISMTTAGVPQAGYSASKAGLNGLTRDLAQQWTGRKGIRVNAVAPGFFTSELTDQMPAEFLDREASRTLVGRLGEHEELAAAVLFLASDAAGFVTGQVLVVDGGRTIT